MGGGRCGPVVRLHFLSGEVRGSILLLPLFRSSLMIRPVHRVSPMCSSLREATDRLVSRVSRIWPRGEVGVFTVSDWLSPSSPTFSTPPGHVTSGARNHLNPRGST